MTTRAYELGATRTRFANAHGLDNPNHYSTAHDLALLSVTAMRFPTFSQVVRTPQFQAQTISASWQNTNRLLWGFEGIEGIKTGTTSGAGYCLVAAASRDGMQLISVVLGSSDRWSDSSRLLEYGFDEFHLLTLASHGDVLAEVRVPGALGTLRAVVDGDFRVVVRGHEVNDLRVRVMLDQIRAAHPGWSNRRNAGHLRRRRSPRALRTAGSPGNRAALDGPRCNLAVAAAGLAVRFGREAWPSGRSEPARVYRGRAAFEVTPSPTARCSLKAFSRLDPERRW